MATAKKKKKPAKKAKKNKSGRKKKAGQSTSMMPDFIMKGVKWLFVAGLWCGIAAGLLTAWYATELPGIVDSPNFERRAAITVEAYDGSALTRYGELKGVSVDVAELPPYMTYAVMAVEDRRFYNHFGIDPVGIMRAMARNLKEGHIAQGGSTITQQLAKNLFLSHERTLKRKIQEALLAIWLERQLTKDEILTAYLNRVYLGSGAYGIDAASQTYFNKPATDISLYEAAMLAGLLKAPSRYSPLSNPGLAAQRARVVLAAMHDAGYISESEVKAQSLKGQASMPKPTGKGPGERYFTDWITANLDDMIGTPGENLTIRTTLDPEIQNAAETALADALRKNKDRDVTQGAMIVMDKNGAILAMVGGADYGKSQFNRATQAKRPPGSAFKPFVYLTALETGWKPHDLISDAPITDGEYQPENFNNEYLGNVTLTTALAHSLNTATVRLAQDVGINNVITTARKLGIVSKLSPDLSLALGSSGIPLFELVRAYGTLANDGIEVTPYSISKIIDENGELLYIRSSAHKERRAARRYSAGELREMMEEAIEEGTGKRARLPFDASGKTGTSQNHRDAWFIGFTDKYIAGVWVGNDDNSPMQGVTGGTIPAEIWHDVMLTAHKKKGPQQPLLHTASDTGETGGFMTMLKRLLAP